MYVVNKADRDGAEQVRRELRSTIALGDRPEGGWKPPIVLTVAQSGRGVDEVVAGAGPAPRVAGGERRARPAAYPPGP